MRHEQTAESTIAQRTGIHMTCLLGALLTLAGAHAAAAQLVPHSDADAKFEVMERSIYLYDDEPYTIKQALKKNEIAGLSVVVLYDGKPAIHRWYGDRIHKKDKATTSSTKYQCASMSKMIASLGVLAAARNGELDLDQSIRSFNRSHPNTMLTDWEDKYFKGDEANWPTDITLRRLLSHSAGLDVHGISAAPWLPSKQPLESILFGRSVFKNAVKPIHKPGTEYDYSGGGYTVAEAWLEIATGKKFKNYLKDHVLDPLGMTRSTFETGSTNTPHLAWGCSKGVCLYNVRSLDVKAAGGLLCHPVDYARAVALLMNGGREYLSEDQGQQLIPEDDVAQLLTPSVHKRTGEQIPSGGEWYGLGVSLSESIAGDGLPTRFSHGGAQQGFSNYFYAHRSRDVGVVVLVNGKREWVKKKEVYGGTIMEDAVTAAFKYAYGVTDSIGPKKPLCSSDADCPDSKYCDKGTITVGKNQCVAKKADGKGCTRQSQCAGGACNVRCYTPDSKNLGQSCNLDAECSDGTCSAAGWGVAPGKCVCTNDSHCSSGQYCNKGVAGIGTNTCKPLLGDGAVCTKAHQCKSSACNVRCYTPDSKNFGQSCNLTAECKKGKCSGTGWGAIPGKCVCDSDGDCGSDQYCNKGVAGIGTNACKPLLSDGAVCTKAHQCSGGACNVRCYTPDSKNLGQSCNLDAECSDGTCSAAGWGVAPGKCVCTNDSHCSSGQYCNEGVAGIGTNACKPLLSDGAVCTKAHQCKGGACNVRCYTPDSKSLGQSCNLNAECKKGKCSGTGWGAIAGKCVCDSDGDCGSGQYCNTGIAGIGTNVCKPELSLGKACTKGKQCKSNCCKVYNFKLQCRPTDKCN